MIKRLDLDDGPVFVVVNGIMHGILIGTDNKLVDREILEILGCILFDVAFDVRGSDVLGINDNVI